MGSPSGIDATTPAGRLQLRVLGAIAEFERSRISERVKAGLARAKADGKRLGRPYAPIPTDRLLAVRDLSHAEAAQSLGVSLSTVKRWRKLVKQTPWDAPGLSPRSPRDSRHDES